MGWTPPVSTTPSIIQTGFGPWGEDIPGDGEAYCGPTSLLMGLYYLSANGFTQLAPVAYGGPDDPAAANLEDVIAGLIGTSTSAGTGGGMAAGIAAYLSARGIPPDLYTYFTTGNPDLQWIADEIGVNVAPTAELIALVCFSVGWYSPASEGSTTFVNDGGHVLAPLTADVAAGTLCLNNAYPASFFDVPNDPDQNPQTVTIASVPSDWTLPGLEPNTGQYSQVMSGNKGSGSSYAVLWGGNAWVISAAAAASGYQPATWTIDAQQVLNTNGGTLEVLAPLAGSGGLLKQDSGTLMLTAPNALTGGNFVAAGTLASTAGTAAPFGTGGMVLQGCGTLSFTQTASVSAQTLASAATLGIGTGACLSIAGSGTFALAVGGHTDGSTPNLTRLAQGTLLIAPGAGLAGLGTTQTVQVAGSGANLPPVTDGIVAPYLLGLDAEAGNIGRFLTYGASGFAVAAPVLSAAVPIMEATADEAYAIVDAQAIPSGAQANVAALEMASGGALSGEGWLGVGTGVSGAVAGLVLNGAKVACGGIGAADAEFVAFAGGTQASYLGAPLTGTGGLTVFGPGTLILGADSSATLSGPVGICSGSVIVDNPGGSGTGSGDVIVHAGATMAVAGSITGAVSAHGGGTLLLSGGTIAGDVAVAAPGATSALPPGTIGGGGTLSGTATVGGNIIAGGFAGLLVFAGTTVIEGSAQFFWTLSSLVDDADSSPGAGWNALEFSGTSHIGSNSGGLTVLLDFSQLGADPDGGDDFWKLAHTWTVLLSPDWCWWQCGNFEYASGSFGLEWPTGAANISLTWTPAQKPRSPAERMRRAAAARQRARAWPGRPGQG